MESISSHETAAYTTDKYNSPLNRLPAELIAEIFLFCALSVPPEKSVLELPVRSSWHEPEQVWNRMPLLLSAICRRWRLIAISTSQLWERISLRFKKPLEGNDERILLSQWLKRSGDRPISLRTTDNIYTRIDSEVDESAFFNMIRSDMMEPIIRKCRLLNFELYEGDDSPQDIAFKRMSMELLAGASSSLEELYVYGTYDNLDLRECRHLHTLVSYTPFCCFHIDESTPKNIRRLQIAGETRDLCRVLSQSSIIDCSFRIEGLVQEDAPSQLQLTCQPFISPSLVAFDLGIRSLESLDQSNTSDVLDQISLPSLKVFRVDLYERRGETANPSWLSLYSFLQRSHPPLKYLFLQSTAIIPDEELIDVLSWMPTLERIHFDFQSPTPITANFWRALRGNSVSPEDEQAKSCTHDQSSFIPRNPLCPQLGRLEVTDLNATAHDHALADIVATVFSRFHFSGEDTSGSNYFSSKQNTLQHLAVFPCPFDHDTFVRYPGMANCIQMGLNVEVQPWSTGRNYFRLLS